VKKKHSSHSITDDISILEMAKSAQFFLSDGIVITGKSTGEAADLSELKVLQKQMHPLIIGSGITKENIEMYWNFADGFIIGSYFKEKGIWSNPLSLDRTNALMEKVFELRNK
jgi:uncharacterized protein